MRIALMLIVALAQTDVENCTAERITFVTSRRERPRGGIGKSEDQRKNGERTGLGLIQPAPPKCKIIMIAKSSIQ